MKRRILFAALLLIFLLSVSVTLHRRWQEERAREEYAQAEELVQPGEAATPGDAGQSTPTDAFAEELSQLDLSRLQQTNPDVVGWIAIPDTELNYPLLQGENNTYYLTHTWDDTSNPAGSIFLESTNSAELDGFSTIIYGHRMNNDSMFGSLKYYRQEAYCREHPNIYIVNESAVWRYAVFAAYEAGVTSRTYYLEFSTDADKQAFIDHSLSASVFESGIVPGTDDRFLTLSTCTGNGYDTRWVVQAVLEQVFERQAAGE